MNTQNSGKDNKLEPLSLVILIVDDDELVRKTIDRILTKHGHETAMASNGQAALKLVAEKSFDIALLDYNLPDTNGIELVTKIKEMAPSVLSLIVTGFGTIERAVEAMQAGAWDFITKPITSGMLIEKIERVREFCYLRREHDYRTKVLNRDFAFSGVVGPSASMQPVYESILRASTSSLPVLIEGETGCGKEYIAEAIHLNSKRQDKPFIILDCTATPSSLIEATLFGSTKGAFTGAIERKGLLEAANAGTLFLDEIGEIDPDIQPKLLRCLETKTFRPVGSTKESKSDFRIICATNRDLLSETKTGNFRQDLYYRLSALRISIPPLREHASDIPVLAKHFLQEIAQEQEEPVDFTPDALRALSRFAWPGNIRQLKFVVENAFFSRQGETIDVGNLALDEDRGPELEDEQEGMGIREEDLEKDFKSFRDEAVMSVEKQYIEQMLERANGDVREAAKLAGLTREALYRVMSRCGISPANYRKK